MSQTFGTAEAIWRAPSVCAWLGLLVLCGWWLSRAAAGHSRPLALATLGLLVLDRLQIFYATEARPYALVALVNLLSWSALAAWSRNWVARGGPQPVALLQGPRRLGWSEVCWMTWCLLNPLACWLQPTAALAVAAQYVFLLSLWSVAGPAGRAAGRLWPVGLGGLVFAVSMLPALPVLEPVWEQRQRWAAFAAGTGPSDVLHLLPFAAFLGPLTIGACLHGWIGLCQRPGAVDNDAVDNDAVRSQRWPRSLSAWLTVDASPRAPEKPASQGDHDRAWWMWLLAWLLPCLAVYLLTASGIAPLMHRRYVFVAAAPFVLWIANSLIRLQGRGLRLAVLLAMIVALLEQQGSLSAWREGDWPAAVRGEDWRGAVRWINSQTNPERPVVVFCASNLIEGAGEIPASEALREYLTLPLRSVYRLEAAERIVPLANDPVRWRSPIAAAMTEHGSAAPWLVVRCTAAGLERRLQASGLMAGERRDFGGVQVARAVRVAGKVGF